LQNKRRGKLLQEQQDQELLSSPQHKKQQLVQRFNNQAAYNESFKQIVINELLYFCTKVISSIFQLEETVCKYARACLT